MKRVIVSKSGLSGGYPFTSYTGEPDVSPDLWSRNQQNILTWEDVYTKFQNIVDTYFPDEDRIESEIRKLYQRNRQSKAYQEAWRRWTADAE